MAAGDGQGTQIGQFHVHFPYGGPAAFLADIGQPELIEPYLRTDGGLLDVLYTQEEGLYGPQLGLPRMAYDLPVVASTSLK